MNANLQDDILHSEPTFRTAECCLTALGGVEVLHMHRSDCRSADAWSPWGGLSSWEDQAATNIKSNRLLSRVTHVEPEVLFYVSLGCVRPARGYVDLGGPRAWCLRVQQQTTRSNPAPPRALPTRVRDSCQLCKQCQKQQHLPGLDFDSSSHCGVQKWGLGCLGSCDLSSRCCG